MSRSELEKGYMELYTRCSIAEAKADRFLEEYRLAQARRFGKSSEKLAFCGEDTMLIDITLKITPKMVTDVQGNEKKALVGHLGTHFDVMNKEFPLEYTKRAVIDSGGVCIVNTYPINYAEMTGLPCRVVAEI